MTQSGCEMCPEDTFSLGGKAMACTPCPASYHANPGSDGCKLSNDIPWGSIASIIILLIIVFLVVSYCRKQTRKKARPSPPKILQSAAYPSRPIGLEPLSPRPGSALPSQPAGYPLPYSQSLASSQPVRYPIPYPQSLASSQPAGYPLPYSQSLSSSQPVRYPIPYPQPLGNVPPNNPVPLGNVPPNNPVPLGNAPQAPRPDSHATSKPSYPQVPQPTYGEYPSRPSHQFPSSYYQLNRPAHYPTYDPNAFPPSAPSETSSIYLPPPPYPSDPK